MTRNLISHSVKTSFDRKLIFLVYVVSLSLYFKGNSLAGNCCFVYNILMTGEYR